MTGAIARGLTLKDFENLTIGQLVDYAVTYNEMYNLENKEEKEQDTVRLATQADMDRF